MGEWNERNDGNVENQGGNAGNQGGNAGNGGGNVGNAEKVGNGMGMQGIKWNRNRKKWNRKNSGNVTAKVADKVTIMLYCRKPEIKVLIKSVQQQRNYIDCGVFTIAFATSLGFGNRPEEIIW